MALPNSGTFSYNGVSFVSLYKSKAEVKPVKDSAARALTAREYTIEVTSNIVADTTDATLASMRIALEKPGGALTYTGKGFGPLIVNQPGGVYDAAYGPWPDVLSWEPIGNDQGCLVRWRCTTLLPCEENPKTKGILEYCWSESWDIDGDGYTSRTIEGHLTIQATRAAVNDRTIPDNADAYREQLAPDLPIGFRREQDFKLSEDKRTLDFTFKDEELPAPLPDGLTGAEVRHKVSWRRGEKGAPPRAVASLSGTLTVPARTNKSFVWDKIMLLIASRWAVGASLGVAANKDFLYLIEGIEVDDEVFGRSTSFSATALVIGTNEKAFGPLSFLTASNLWAPIPNTSFVSWKRSIFGAAGRPYASRGMAGMSFQNGDDAIVDLCSGGAVLKGNSAAPGQTRVLRTRQPLMGNGQEIDPALTWLQYRMRIRLLEEDRVIRHVPLQPQTLKTIPATDDFFTLKYQDSPGLTPPRAAASSGNVGRLQTQEVEETIGAAGPGIVGGTGALVQEVSQPLYTIRLEGYATRLGYSIPIPRLDNVGGVSVTQTRQDVTQEQTSSIAGVPVYAATWCIDYTLPKAVGAVLPMPVNPAVD